VFTLHRSRCSPSTDPGVHVRPVRADAALFLEAAGSRAPEALTVSVAAARRLLGEAELEAISETLTTPALRVEPLPGGTR